MKLAMLFFLSYSMVAPTASAGQTQKFQFSPGALLRAQFDKTIDANKAKVGDVITVRLTDDLKRDIQVLAPRNSKIFGHITQVAQRRGDSPSVLGIAFERLELKDGSDVAFKATIQAIGIPSGTLGDDWIPVHTQAQGVAAGQADGATGTMGQPDGYYGGRLPGGASDTPAAKLSPNARGVVGISGASLSNGPEQDSVITSQKHNVKIESGAQIILCIQ